MRIVGGRFRGRGLMTPRHEGVRPTSDRVRESVFNILEHGVQDFEIEGARVVDLFAGTGALGLEALSRGAAFALFVDQSAPSRAVIRENIEAFGLTGVAKIFRRDATDLGPAGTMAPFQLAFLDAPYGKGLVEKGLQTLAKGGWLSEGALCVAEESDKATFQDVAGFDLLDERSYGDTVIRILRFGSADVF